MHVWGQCHSPPNHNRWILDYVNSTNILHWWPCQFYRCTLSPTFFTVLAPFVDDSLHTSSHPVQVDSTTGRADIQGRYNQHKHQWRSRMNPTFSETGANSIKVSTTKGYFQWNSLMSLLLSADDPLGFCQTLCRELRSYLGFGVTKCSCKYCVVLITLYILKHYTNWIHRSCCWICRWHKHSWCLYYSKDIRHK